MEINVSKFKILVSLVCIVTVHMTVVASSTYLPSESASYVKELAASMRQATGGYMADALKWGKAAIYEARTLVADAYNSSFVQNLSMEQKAALGALAAGLAGYGAYRWFNKKYMQPSEGFLAFKTDKKELSVTFTLAENKPNNVRSRALKIAIFNVLTKAHLKKVGIVGENEDLAAISNRPITIEYALNRDAYAPQSVWVSVLKVNPLRDYDFNQMLAYCVVRYLQLEDNYEHAVNALEEAHNLGMLDAEYNQEKWRIENTYSNKKREIEKMLNSLDKYFDLEDAYQDAMNALKNAYSAGMKDSEFKQQKDIIEEIYKRKKSLLVKQATSFTDKPIDQPIQRQLTQPQRATTTNLPSIRQLQRKKSPARPMPVQCQEDQSDSDSWDNSSDDGNMIRVNPSRPNLYNASIEEMRQAVQQKLWEKQRAAAKRK